MLLFPESPLRERAVDEHFLPEAQDARWIAERFSTVSLEELQRGASAATVLRHLPTPSASDHHLLYRGWMLSPATYREVAAAAAARGWTLVTDGEQYERAHTLPGWYAALEKFTPATVWAPTAVEAVEAARAKGWASAVVRDYSKSMKHAWDEACYIPALEKKKALTVAKRFEELRGEDLAGGVVLREFETFSKLEARTWWRDGEWVLTTPHPDTPDQLPEGLDTHTAAWMPKKLKKAVKSLALGFCTVDFAFTVGGEPRVVELGDGGVSDRPSCTDADDFLEAIIRH